MKKIGILLISLGFLSLTSLVRAQAQPVDLAVSPPTTYLHVVPGKSAEHKITLEQHGSLPLKITPSVVDFESDGKTGQPVLQFKEGTKFRYLKIANPDVSFGQAFDLNPGQKKQIVFTVEPPSEAVQGEFPLTILFSAQPNTEVTLGTHSTGTQVSGIVASNLIILVSTSDSDKGKLVLEEIQTPRLVDSFAALHFSLLAKNHGRNATTASGSASIKNWQQETVAEYTFYPDMILAEATRLLRHGEALESDDPDHLSSTFRYKPLFLIGPYTITARLNENGLDNQSYTELSYQVFAFPFSLLLLLLVGLTLLVVHRYVLLRSSSKNA